VTSPIQTKKKQSKQEQKKNEAPRKKSNTSQQNKEPRNKALPFVMHQETPQEQSQDPQPAFEGPLRSTPLNA
jgi:hypothetical protein